MSTSPTAELQRFIDRLTARSVLSEEEQQAILALPTSRIELRAKQDLVHINEETTHGCLVTLGLVARVGQTRAGHRQITAFHIPGDMADLNSAVRPVGIGGLTALCETTVLKVPHVALRKLAARYPAIAEAFWRDCMLDAAVLMQWVVNVGRRGSQTRIAHMLCEMAIRYGDDREVLREFTFPVTQEQLADVTALTSVHVNRSLKALREAGLATVKGGTVRIHDWAKLARLGEFDAIYLLADTKAERQKRLINEE